MYQEIENFLQYLQHEKQFSKHTVTGYKTDLLDAVAFFNTQHANHWQTIQESTIRALLVSRKSKKKSARTLNRQLSTLRSFYRYLILKGVVQDNKALKVSTLKSSRLLPKAIDVDQMSKLLEYPASNTLAIRDIALIELLYSTGFRISELVSLNVTDLDFEQQQIFVMGKGKKSRIALIGQYADKALKAWLKIRATFVKSEEPALFISKHGKRLTTRAIQYRLYKIGIQQGLSSRIHPHRLRHSFASHLLESSHDLRGVQELLGHTNLSSTQIYTKINFQHLAKIYDQCHPRASKQSKENKK
jgi:integrase/recombinase XerC